jgi:hypothetical protein
VNDFEAEIEAVKKKLDQIETELIMNQEAMESIEMRVRLLKTELDFEIDRNGIIE